MTTPRGGAAELFVEEALAQAGDRYVFGAEANPNDPNPTTFDCSELVQWAAHQAGVDVPDGSWLQYQQLQQEGGAVSVEQALHTRGALLFYFSSSPDGAGRPAEAHVAISLGDGRTIEARSTKDGVGVFTANSIKFNYAAVIPQLSGGGVPSGGFGPGAGFFPGFTPGGFPGVAAGVAADPFGLPGAALPSAVAGGPGQTDTDGDGLTDQFEALLHTDPNKADTDGDGLSDVAETTVFHTDPLKADTDGDGVSDGFEFQSALDLNDDDYQHPNGTVPYPGTRPYPNPLDGSDADTDFDGDGLTLGIEYRLWRYSVAHNGAPNSLSALTYSDGLKYSIYTRDAAANNRRVPALPVAGYSMTTKFLDWATANHYAQVQLPDDPGVFWGITDFSRSGSSDPNYLDTHGEVSGSAPDGFLSDDERDEDGDGLSNYEETIGPMRGQSWWDTFYGGEKKFKLDWPGTQADNPDSDGDGIVDGADDQDHDDYPNIVEAERGRVVGFLTPDNPSQSDLDALALPPWGRVQPFNPCLPDIHSRSCPTYTPLNGWAPFDNSLDYQVVQ
jgi:Bacterial TSP3 repeat/NlpC/P60 family